MSRVIRKSPAFSESLEHQYHHNRHRGAYGGDNFTSLSSPPSLPLRSRSTSLKRKRPSETSTSKMNLRHRLVCDETVQWLAQVGGTFMPLPTSLESSLSNETPNSSTSSSAPFVPVEELWLGPVFESCETILSAIRTLPASVTHLDLDLRNALHLLKQAVPLLFSKTHIKTLSVRVFGDAGAVELAKWIHKNPSLERLDVRGNRIGSLGARTMVDAILACDHKLKHLNLSCNCILDGDLIGQLLAMSSNLEHLDLGFNWLGNQEVLDICQGLLKNTSLRELNIYGCQRITKMGLMALLTCLQEDNMSLHQVKVQSLDEESDRLVESINHWTSLNKAGRYLIHHLPCSSSSSSPSDQEGTVPSGLWPLVMEKSKDQPDALYYFLRQGSPRILSSQS